MATEVPQPALCRARHLRTMLQTVQRLPEHDRVLIERAVPSTVYAAIEGATVLAWVDMQHNLELTRLISTRLGPRRSRAFYRSFLGAAYESPLMRNFMQASLRISQRDVGLGLRLMPTGYDLIFRNVGRWDGVEIGQDSASLRLLGLPAGCMDGVFWIESVAGSLESVFDLGGREGRVDIVDTDVESGRVDFALRWQR